MKKRPELYVGLAADALEIVLRRLPDTREAFLQDEVLQDATLMRLQEAGEHLAHIRDNFGAYYDAHHSQAWYELVGLRNVISHGYLQIDIEEYGIQSPIRLRGF